MFMLETLFLLSLGITFVLILLLIYHFKNRLSGLEQKHEVLLEVLNTLVQETHMLKSVVGSIWRPQQVNSEPVVVKDFSNNVDDCTDDEEDLDVEEIEEEEEDLEGEDLEEEDLEDLKGEDLDEQDLKVEAVEDNVKQQVEPKADLDKMKLPDLRALVTQLGLSADASKLKKSQLVELLQNA